MVIRKSHLANFYVYWEAAAAATEEDDWETILPAEGKKFGEKK